MRRFTAVGALSLLAACTPQDSTITGPAGGRGQPVNATGDVVSETSSDLWARIITGETGPGSRYQMYLPRDWNGTAVFYAHGFRDVLEPLSLRNQDNLWAIRDELGRRGIAVAYSSYSENGFAERDGAQRTHQLRGLFTSEFGAPARSLLVGHSLGSLVVMDLAGQFAEQYDGVAAFCGVLGGTQKEFDYLVTTRMLFDMFYPGVLPGSYNEPPSNFFITPTVQGQIIAAIGANPIGLAAIGSVEQAHLQFDLAAAPAVRQQQMVTSLITALTFHARGADNVLPLMNGFPFVNAETQYTVGVPLIPDPPLGGIVQWINAAAPRTSGDPAALNYTSHYFTPSGALEIPTLTLHNQWDPLVPYVHESWFRDRVIEAGATGRLVQRTKAAYGHCNFTVAEQVQAIMDLAQWVETGIKPND